MGFWDIALPIASSGLSSVLGMFGGDSSGKAGMPSLMDVIGQAINEYSYKPQYTGQTETSLYNLFQDLTGQSGKGATGIPFEIGLPTDKLYEANTRGEREALFGMPGAGESGSIADIMAKYNEMGIPEQSLQATRQMIGDWDRYSMDQAAKLTESSKDRLSNVLGMGLNTGQNLYNQNLGQHRFNTGLMSNAATRDYELQDSINQANAGALSSLFGSAGPTIGKTIQSVGGSLGSLLSKNTPTTVSRSGTPDALANPYGKGYSKVAKLI